MSDVARLTISVRSDVANAVRSLGQLDAALRRAAGSGNGTSDSLNNTTNSADRTGDAMRRMSSDTDRSARSLDNFSKSSGKSNINVRSLLISLAIVAGTSLVPMAGASVGALAALGAAATSVTLGLGIYGLALKDLLGSAGPANDAVRHIAQAFDEWAQANSKVVVKPIADFLNVVKPGLTLLTPLLDKTSAALDKGVKALAGWVKGKEAATNIKALTAAFTPLAANLGGALGNALRGILNLFVAFLPTSIRLTGGIKGLSDTFLKWSQNLDKNQGFQKFVRFVNTEGPKVWNDLGIITASLIKFTTALNPLGTLVLTGLTNLIKYLGELDPATINAIATAIAAVVLASKGLELIAPLIAFIATPVGAVVAAITLLAVGFYELYQKSQPFHDWVVNKLVPGLRNLWDLISAQVKPALDAIWSSIQTHVVPALESFWSSVQKAWTNAQPFVQLIGTVLKGGLLTLKEILIEVVIPALGLLVTAFGTVIRWASQVVGGLASLANYGIQNFMPAVRQVADFFVSAWNNVYTALQTAARNIVQAFANMALNIVKAADVAFGWIPGLGGKLDKAKSAIESFKDSVNASMGGIKPKTIPVTISFNGVNEGSITGHSYTSTTGFTYANGGAVRGPGSSTSDSIPAYLSNGEYVINAAATAKNRPLLDQINSGRQGFAAGGMVGFNNATAADGKLAAKMEIDKTTKSIASSYATAFNKYQSSIAHAVDLPGSAADWIHEGLKIVGRDNALWFNGISIIAANESGGNPTIVNNYDSNAKAGTPSMGLLQFIQPTFDAYAMAGHKNILNPVDQVIADARPGGYIDSAYGGISNVPGVRSLNAGHQYLPYRLGGMAKGLSLVGENGPEIIDGGTYGTKVYNNKQTREMLGGGSGGDINVIYNGTVYQGGPDDAADVAFKLRTQSIGFRTR
ncbi:transglycosylase SLT domain-containing protein [Streptacidiphilus sp. N1-12]|uniref:Transglycosylase SLT domain-containing protein n=2 Tax=Streptacidiphilus alkalitolerans TaxID=3342712 RepID=A0ABV6VID5_9ACTN